MCHIFVGFLIPRALARSHTSSTTWESLIVFNNRVGLSLKVWIGFEFERERERERARACQAFIVIFNEEKKCLGIS